MKNGIEYFPLDVVLDDKFELIEAEFGLTGFGVVVKILSKIYGGQGYYVEWTNEVALLFAKKLGLGGNVVSEIVSASIKRGIFDERLFAEYSILTSSGIQKRYFEAVSRRKNVDVREEYLLGGYAQKFKNVNISGKNVNISPKNADNSEQSKVEESKEEYSTTTARTRTVPSVEECRTFCSSKNIKTDADAFHRHFSALGWIVGGEPVRNWRALLLKWAEEHPSGCSTTQNTDDPTATNGTSFDSKDYIKAALRKSYGE